MDKSVILLLIFVVSSSNTVRLLLPTCVSAATVQTTDEVNSIWLDEYSNGKNFVVNDTPIILVADNQNVVAFEYGSRTPSPKNWTVDLSLYTNLKVICHSVLGLFGTCSAAQNNTGSGCEGTTANQYLDNVQNVIRVTVPNVPQDVFYDPSMALLGYCNDTVISFIDSGCSAEAAKTCLDSLQGTAGLLNPLVDGAGDSHVAQYGGTIDQVRKDIGEDLWDKAVVAVLGGSQPRAANIEYGLWLQRRGAASQGLTLFYIENVGIDDTDAIFSSLETDLGDQSLSEYVFLNPFRMSEDLFANTTLKYVKEGFVISGFPNPNNVGIQSSYYRNSTIDTTKNLLKQDQTVGSFCPFASGTVPVTSSSGSIQTVTSILVFSAICSLFWG
jgi:hypothetical protein